MVFMFYYKNFKKFLIINVYNLRILNFYYNKNYYIFYVLKLFIKKSYLYMK